MHSLSKHDSFVSLIMFIRSDVRKFTIRFCSCSVAKWRTDKRRFDAGRRGRTRKCGSVPWRATCCVLHIERIRSIFSADGRTAIRCFATHNTHRDRLEKLGNTWMIYLKQYELCSGTPRLSTPPSFALQ